LKAAAPPIHSQADQKDLVPKPDRKNAPHFVESDSSCGHHHLDGSLDLAIGGWIRWLIDF
jgi:hypothetical protein